MRFENAAYTLSGIYMYTAIYEYYFYGPAEWLSDCRSRRGCLIARSFGPDRQNPVVSCLSDYQMII